MSIPWREKMAAFDAVDLHVQVALQNLARDFHQPYGMLRVSAKVVRIFKAPEQITIGSDLEFDLPVYTGDKGEFPDGWLHCWYEDLLLHPHLEVCLNGNPPLCRLAEDLVETIPGPTAAPVINFEQERKAQQATEMPQTNKKWWKFW